MAFTDSLTDRTESLEDSANWTLLTAGNDDVLGVDSGGLYHIKAGSDDPCLWHAPDTSTADHYVQVEPLAQSSNHWVMAARMSATQALVVRFTIGPNAQAYRWESGSGYTAEFNTGITAAQGDGTWRFTCSGSTVTLDIDDGDGFDFINSFSNSWTNTKCGLASRAVDVGSALSQNFECTGAAAAASVPAILMNMGEL